MNDDMEAVDGIWYEYDFDNAVVTTQTDDEIGSFVSIPAQVRDSDGFVHKVTKIEASAFALCKKLEAVEIDDDITEIEKDAFSNCDNLKIVKLPASLTKINDYLFFNCKSLPTLLIPDTVESIGNWAFGICKNLSQIDLPTSLKSIGNKAFSNCDKLESIFIPAGVTSIGEDVFYMSRNLKTIQVDPANATYYSKDNCVYERATNKLIASSKTNVIPVTVKQGGSGEKSKGQKQGFLGKLKNLFK